jgi:hypothetical protein
MTAEELDLIGVALYIDGKILKWLVDRMSNQSRQYYSVRK